MRNYAVILALALSAFTSSVSAQEIKFVEQNLTHKGQQSIADYKMSCTPGYTPIGVRIVSNRLAGNFQSVPEGETATMAFFDWAGGGSQASTIVRLICQKS